MLFIGGLGRSGSTLLELVLAQHPDVCALGEVVHLWQRGLVDDERCGCGERFAGCEFWQELGRRAFGGWSKLPLDRVTELKAAVDRTRYIPRLARYRLPDQLRREVHEYTSYYQRIYQAARELTGATVVVDSSKHASLAFALRHSPGLDLRVLHLVRDSRGVAYSWARQVRRPEVVDADAYMPRFSTLTVSGLWTVQNGAFHLLSRAAPVTRLRYEDFTADPQGWLRRIRELVDLPDDPAAGAILRDPPTSPSPAHTVAGNPLRFAAGPLRINRDDRWRAALPRPRRTMVSLLTLPLRLRYGYYRGRREATT